MLREILNNSWGQHPTKQQLYGPLPPITKIIKLYEPDTQDSAGEVGTNAWVMYSCGPLHMDEQRQLCADMGWSPEDLPKGVAREGQKYLSW